MEEITTKTIIMAVNIFITIIIVSLIIIMFSQMGDIYGVVANTDTSITTRFDDVYSMYHGRVETGVGLLNTLKYFEEHNEYDVVIKYTAFRDIRGYVEEYNSMRDEEHWMRESEYLKKLIESESTDYERVFKYEDKYNVTVYEEDEKTVIRFSKI